MVGTVIDRTGENMPLPAVRLGDLTSHGGKVISASLTHLINGVGIARIGDTVVCPVAGHGVNAIIEGAPTYLIGGRMVALHGHHSACGCTLISSLVTATHG
jgi:uncharacterized Zn-binding protein involved in type VI secretion